MMSVRFRQKCAPSTHSNLRLKIDFWYIGTALVDYPGLPAADSTKPYRDANDVSGAPVQSASCSFEENIFLKI